MTDGVTLPERVETKIIQDFQKITNGQPRMTKQDFENVFLARCPIDKNGNYSLPEGWAGSKDETIGTVLAGLDKKFEAAEKTGDKQLNIDEYTAMVKEEELENYNKNLGKNEQNNTSQVDEKTKTESTKSNSMLSKIKDAAKEFFGNLIKKLFSMLGNLLPF